MSLTKTREIFAMLKREKSAAAVIMRDARNSGKAYCLAHCLERKITFFCEIDRFRQLPSICTCFIHVQMHDAHRVNVAKKLQQTINKIIAIITRVVYKISINLLLF